MGIWSSSREALEKALTELGFSAIRQFGVFTTYERQRDSLKVHAAPDSMFAVFGEADDFLGEGAGAEDLRSLLVKAAHNPPQAAAQRSSFEERRTKKSRSSSQLGGRARAAGARAEQASAALSENAFLK